MVVSAIGYRMVVSHYWIQNGCNKVTIGYRMVVSAIGYRMVVSVIGYRMVVSHYWIQNGCKSLLDTEWL